MNKSSKYSVHERLAELENAAVEHGKSLAIAHAENARLKAEIERVAAKKYADSNRPGPKGDTGIGKQGPQGMSGASGRDGKDGTCICQTTLDAVQPLRGEISNMRAEFAEHKRLVQSLIDMDKRSSEYLEFLRQKVAARLKKV